MSPGLHSGLLALGLFGGLALYVPLVLWAVRAARGLIAVARRARRPVAPPRPQRAERCTGGSSRRATERSPRPARSGGIFDIESETWSRAA